jgi:hypothetical protein
MGGQPGKPKPPGNPPVRPEPQQPAPIEEPPRPIPIPPVERPPAPIGADLPPLGRSLPPGNGILCDGKIFEWRPNRLEVAIFERAGMGRGVVGRVDLPSSYVLVVA